MTSEFLPDWASPPWETIEECLIDMEVPEKDWAWLLELSDEQLESLKKGELRITEKLAELLNREIGGVKQFWLNRDENYIKDLGRLK